MAFLLAFGGALPVAPAQGSAFSMHATQLPFGLAGATAIDADGIIYLFGGDDGVSTRSEIYEYDPLRQTLIQMGATVPHGAQMSGVWDGRDLPEIGCEAGCVYLFGGWGGNPSDQILAYNPATDTMRVTPWVLPSPRYGTAAVWLDGEAWIVGGTGVSATALDEIVAFEPIFGAVRRSDFLKLPSAGSGLVVASDGSTAIVVGLGRYVEITAVGGGATSHSLSQNPLFGPATAAAPHSSGGWLILPWMGRSFGFHATGSGDSSSPMEAALPRALGRAAYVWDGYSTLYLIGGETDIGLSASIFEYAPAYDAFSTDDGAPPIFEPFGGDEGTDLEPGTAEWWASPTGFGIMGAIGLLLAAAVVASRRKKARDERTVEPDNKQLPPGGAAHDFLPPTPPPDPPRVTPGPSEVLRPLVDAMPPGAERVQAQYLIHGLPRDASPAQIEEARVAILALTERAALRLGIEKEQLATRRAIEGVRGLLRSFPPGQERAGAEEIVRELESGNPTLAEVEQARADIVGYQGHAKIRVETEAELQRARAVLLREMDEEIATMPEGAERQVAIRLREKTARDPEADMADAWSQMQRLIDDARLGPLRRRGAHIGTKLDALLVRAPDLRVAREIRKLIEQGSAGDMQALNAAEERLAAVEPLLAEREKATTRVREIAAKLAKLAQRLADGEIDGSSYEAARTVMEAERAQMEERVQGFNAELFVDEFEKPI